MRNVVLALFQGIFLASLVGCSQRPAETVQSVQWYKEHRAERKAKIAECRNHSGELTNSPNCINANAALYWLISGTNPGGEFSDER